MRRRERRRGRFALFLVAGLFPTAGCGNNVSELLRASSAMLVERHGHPGQAGAIPGPALSSTLPSHESAGAERANAPSTDWPTAKAAANRRRDTGWRGERQSGGGLTATLDTTRARTPLPPSYPGPHLSAPAEPKSAPQAKERGK